VKGSGSGVVAKGSGSAAISHATEEALANKFEETWHAQGMENCRKVLDPPPPAKRKTTKSNGDRNKNDRRDGQSPAANAPNGFAITGGTVTSPTVNNFASPGRDDVMNVRVMAVGLINKIERSIANAYHDRAIWTERGEKEPVKFPQRIVSWHLEGVTTGFTREYESEFKAKVVEVRQKLEDHIANPPRPFIGPSRYYLYEIDDGMPCPQQRAEARLYDLVTLLTEMEKESNLPITFPEMPSNASYSPIASIGPSVRLKRSAGPPKLLQSQPRRPILSCVGEYERVAITRIRAARKARWAKWRNSRNRRTL
jgi:hypothetical protein